MSAPDLLDRWWFNVVIGVLGVWGGISSLRDGSTWSFARTVKRVQFPLEYWFFVAVYLIGGAALVVLGILRLLASG